MRGHRFPRIPYDEVRSPFIREAIRGGCFEDLAHRTCVNDLVYVEWYTVEGVHPEATGMSRAGAMSMFWRIATSHPAAFDAVRRDLGAETRGEYRWTTSGDEDPQARRRWARRHRAEWNAVQGGEEPPEESAGPTVPIADRPSFAPFRFPKLPYTELESAFVIGEIGRGSFDDMEHRRYVNELVYIETWTREPERMLSGGYPPITPWIVAAKNPDEFDWIRRDLGASTRREIDPIPEAYYSEAELASRPERHKREWVAVQEGGK